MLLTFAFQRHRGFSIPKLFINSLQNLWYATLEDLREDDVSHDSLVFNLFSDELRQELVYAYFKARRHSVEIVWFDHADNCRKSAPVVKNSWLRFEWEFNHLAEDDQDEMVDLDWVACIAETWAVKDV